MLGAIDQTHLLRLLEAVAADDARAVLSVADEMAGAQPVLRCRARRPRQPAAAHGDGADVPDALGEDLPERAAIVDLAARVDAESVQLYYEIALQAGKTCRSRPRARGLSSDPAAHGSRSGRGREAVTG